LRRRRRRYTVHVDAAAWNVTDSASLPTPLREDVETRGRAALQEQLDGENYPRRIFVDSSGVRTEGEQVFCSPPALVRIAIGAVVGYALTRIVGGTVALNSFLGALVFGLAPALFTKTLWELLSPLIVQPGRRQSDQIPIRRLALEEISAWRRARRACKAGRFMESSMAAIDKELAVRDPPERPEGTPEPS
jgi:hypothetical protein